MVSWHTEVKSILQEIGEEWGCEIGSSAVAICSKTKRRKDYSTIQYKPDVVWKYRDESAILEVESGQYGDEKQQKYLLGTMTLAFLHVKQKGPLNTYFYIVVDNEEIRNQVFKLLHCMDDYLGPTFREWHSDFKRQIILAPSEMARNEKKRYLKKQLKAWQ